MALENAELTIVAAQHGAAAFGTPVGFAFEHRVEHAELSEPGEEGPSALGPMNKRLVAEVEWLDGAPVPPGTVADLAVTVRRKDGAHATFTLASMKAGTYAKRTGSAPFRWRQRFEHRGAIASDPLAIS